MFRNHNLTWRSNHFIHSSWSKVCWGFLCYIRSAPSPIASPLFWPPDSGPQKPSDHLVKKSIKTTNNLFPRFVVGKGPNTSTATLSRGKLGGGTPPPLPKHGRDLKTALPVSIFQGLPAELWSIRPPCFLPCGITAHSLPEILELFLTAIISNLP